MYYLIATLPKDYSILVVLTESIVNPVDMFLSCNIT
jgi:hypothetical protein